MDNPYLFENKVLSDNWTNCIDIIKVQENIDAKWYVYSTKINQNLDKSDQELTWKTWVRRVFDVAVESLEYSLKEINRKN